MFRINLIDTIEREAFDGKKDLPSWEEAEKTAREMLEGWREGSDKIIRQDFPAGRILSIVDSNGEALDFIAVIKPQV